MTDLILNNPSQVTDDVGKKVYRELFLRGVSHLLLDVGYGVQRLVIVPLSIEDREFMVALENDGCVFFKQSCTVNKFKFISAGFFDTSASIAVAVLAAISRIQECNTRPQIADNRSDYNADRTKRQ